MLHFIWTIIIGFVAGLIARAVTPGDKGPQGFILAAILGIIGALAATYLGQAIGWYGPDQNAGFIGAIVGAVLILIVWGFLIVVEQPDDNTPVRSFAPIAGLFGWSEAVHDFAPTLAAHVMMGPIPNEGTPPGASGAERN